MVADLGLLFCAMSLTGGALSPYALLLPAGVALVVARRGKAGRPVLRDRVASRAWPRSITLGNLPAPGASSLFTLAGVALAAPALLVTLEVSRPPRRRETATGSLRRSEKSPRGAAARPRRAAPRRRSSRDSDERRPRRRRSCTICGRPSR